MGHLLWREKEKEGEIEIDREREFRKSKERVRGIKMRNNISPVSTFSGVIYVEKKMNAGKNKNKTAKAHCKVCSDRP